MLHRAVCVLAFCALTSICPAQEFDESFEHWPVDVKINGTIIAASEFAFSESFVEPFLRTSGNDKAKIVLIDFRKTKTDSEKLKDAFKDAAAFESIEAVSDSFAVDATKLLETATGVMILDDSSFSSGCLNRMTSIQKPLKKLINRGGAVYVCGDAAKSLSKHVITRHEQTAVVLDGLNLVPDSAIALNSDDKTVAEVKNVLKDFPRTIGIAIEKQTAIVLIRRRILATGNGSATFFVTGNGREKMHSRSIDASNTRERLREQDIIDLTQWRRVAIDRTLAPFPPAKPEPPIVENGSLIIIGGGRPPKGLMESFIEMAGGSDAAKLVYIPCSERDEIPGNSGMVNAWIKSGVKTASIVHTKDRIKANTDQKFLEPLKDATGIWFGGGRQWNFSDSYYGTAAHELMKKVLQRGGVIGGSSAGASIQARYLARATPIGNFRIMAPGYERGGLGFISGVAIDQHFSQRGRQKDMTQLVDRYPQLLGIGIDESTALIVRKSEAKIVGQGKVYFYDRNLHVPMDGPDYLALPSGTTYDLAIRKVVSDKEEASDKQP